MGPEDSPSTTWREFDDTCPSIRLPQALQQTLPSRCDSQSSGVEGTCIQGLIVAKRVIADRSGTVVALLRIELVTVVLVGSLRSTIDPLNCDHDVSNSGRSRGIHM